LKRLKKDRTRSELTITGHPLKPGQHLPTHVKGGNGKKKICFAKKFVKHFIHEIYIYKAKKV